MITEYNLTTDIVEELFYYLSEYGEFHDIGPSAALDEMLAEYKAASAITVTDRVISFIKEER